MKDELTTKEIFEESMKLSEPAYKEKGEKLLEYQRWLRKKWKCVGEEELKESEKYEYKRDDREFREK